MRANAAWFREVCVLEGGWGRDGHTRRPACVPHGSVAGCGGAGALWRVLLVVWILPVVVIVKREYVSRKWRERCCR